MLTVVVSAIALAAAPASAEPFPEQPALVMLPTNVVAVVSELPVEPGTITVRELEHALAIGAAAAGFDSVPALGTRRYERIEARAMAELIDSAWLRGQAAEMDIVVTPKQIAREREAIKEQAFGSDAEWHRFTKESRFTRRDVNERVELQIIAFRIEQRVLAGIHGDSERRKAMREFVVAYQRRWRARTVCAPDYVIGRCSSGWMIYSRKRHGNLSGTGYDLFVSPSSPPTARAVNMCLHMDSVKALQARAVASSGS